MVSDDLLQRFQNFVQLYHLLVDKDQSLELQFSLGSEALLTESGIVFRVGFLYFGDCANYFAFQFNNKYLVHD